MTLVVPRALTTACPTAVAAALLALAVGHATDVVHAHRLPGTLAALLAALRGILAALPGGLANGQTRTIAKAEDGILLLLALAVAALGRTVGGTTLGEHLHQPTDTVAAGPAVNGTALRSLLAVAVAVAAWLHAIQRAALVAVPDLPADAVPTGSAVNGTKDGRLPGVALAITAIDRAILLLALRQIGIQKVLKPAYSVAATTAVHGAEALRVALPRVADGIAAGAQAILGAKMLVRPLLDSANPVTAGTTVLGAKLRTLRRLTRLTDAVAARRTLAAIIRA